ncbi:enoyl-CoA hydratase/isomerase family protein [Bacillus sp. EB106-08-02-XG196]|uniref:enoyl-CoA hydratase/isomerase family protein n=1 Tax=Bacillus sp. EB106-08-02-XG196 TaxID=2737049 RepID=UPI0015C4B6A4|nr:enoyl-CoA hydratase/isomerase family protein [Bacillus sp. EB106-08-02-XG196]NWQ43413.1 enoyl-CoA hydratase/isomerase family protein [Bacillus sp. EB106-08-02-XG196]
MTEVKVKKTYETVLCEVKGNVGIISLNRPKQINAITEQLTKDVWNALDELENNKEVKAVVLTGANGNFSSGVDLKEVYSMPNPIGEEPAEVWREHLETLLKVSLKIWDLKKPVIAAVDGYALGGAADWVFACDVAVAADTAIIGEPEIRFGAAPPTLMMPWIVGMRKAKELLFTGDSVDAQEGHRIGIFNRVVPQERLMDEAVNLGERMAKIPPSALKITKVTINKIYEMMNIKESLDYNLEAAIAMFFLNKPEGVAEVGESIRRDGLKKFLEKANGGF